jgi:hypothetical protein
VIVVLGAFIEVGFAGTAGARPCKEAFLEGEVRYGESWTHVLGGGLSIEMHAVPSGWVVRIYSGTGLQSDLDYAAIATPPYDSINPLRLTTDYSFRAQDAIGWNPREFRYVPSVDVFNKASQLFIAYNHAQHADKEKAADNLAVFVSGMPEGKVEIIDARLVPGIGDQVPPAAAVAQHFLTTAHNVDQPSQGHATPLGRINWIRFRITLTVPSGFTLDRSIQTRQRSCLH